MEQKMLLGVSCYPPLIFLSGQYHGRSCPQLDYHVTIAGFEEKVLIMNSIRKPCRITIRGSDEREHKFLIKGKYETCCFIVSKLVLYYCTCFTVFTALFHETKSFACVEFLSLLTIDCTVLT